MHKVNRGLAALVLLTLLLALAPAPAAALPPGLPGESAANPATTYAELAAAISQASPGDAIHLAGSLSLDDALTVDKPLSLIGSGQAATVLTAASGRRHVIVPGGVTASFSDITFQGPPTAAASGPNGGIQAAETSVLTLSRCTFSANSHLDPFMTGGAVSAWEAAITDCTFTGNAAQAGGAVYTAGPATITGCLFSGNLADSANGGGLSANGTTELVSCAFLDNRANIGGGAFLNNDTRLTGCRFERNLALLDGLGGGGVYANSGVDLLMADCIVTGNTAVGNGGGLYLNGSSSGGKRSVLTGCVITGNSAGDYDHYGGGLFMTGSNNQLTRCTISGNDADSGGGALLFGADNLLSGCTLEGNRAYNGGGALFFGYSYSHSAQLVNCTIINNSADAFSGAVHAYPAFQLTLTSCTVTGNSTAPGQVGGVCCEANATLRAQGSIIAGNSNGEDVQSAGAFWPSQPPSAENGYSIIGTPPGYPLAQVLGSDPPTPGDNGGPTRTVALPKGSPALNAIPLGAATEEWLPDADQRGEPRPFGTSPADVGAVEMGYPYDAALLQVAGQGLAPGPEAGSLSQPVTASVTVAGTVVSITLADLVASDPLATLGLYGDAGFTLAGPVSLAVGANHVYVKVTAQDGVTTIYYDVTVTRPGQTGPPDPPGGGQPGGSGQPGQPPTSPGGSRPGQTPPTGDAAGALLALAAASCLAAATLLSGASRRGRRRPPEGTAA